MAGSKLDLEKFRRLLDTYYAMRGWDERGVPRRSTLEKLGLSFIIPVLEEKVGLTP